MMVLKARLGIMAENEKENEKNYIDETEQKREGKKKFHFTSMDDGNESECDDEKSLSLPI